MAAGHDEEVDVVEGDVVVEDGDEVLGEEGGVGLHDALRLARGAARVHDDPDVVGADGYRRALPGCALARRSS